MPAPVLPNQALPESPEGLHSNTLSSLAQLAASQGLPSPNLLAADGGSAPRIGALPRCLLTESLRSGDGIGPIATIDEFRSKLLVITLGITDVVERTGLTVSVWGSSDESDWGTKPLLTLRQRQYCGVYSSLLNLAIHPDVRFLRVQWNMNRWGKGDRIPLFGFQVFIEESGARVSSSAVA